MSAIPDTDSKKLENEHMTNILAYILDSALICLYLGVLIRAKQRQLATVTKVVIMLSVAVFFQTMTDLTW